MNQRTINQKINPSFRDKLKQIAETKFNEISLIIRNIFELYQIYNSKTQKSILMQYLAYINKLPENCNLSFNTLTRRIEDIDHFKNYMHYAR